VIPGKPFKSIVRELKWNSPRGFLFSFCRLLLARAPQECHSQANERRARGELPKRRAA